MRAISLFTGAGGLDLGAEAAGFETVATVEHSAVAVETLIANRPRYFAALSPRAIYRDITMVEPGELLDAAELSVGDVDLLHGGPPCTPFSKSGYWLEFAL